MICLPFSPHLLTIFPIHFPTQRTSSSALLSSPVSISTLSTWAYSPTKHLTVLLTFSLNRGPFFKMLWVLRRPYSNNQHCRHPSAQHPTHLSRQRTNLHGHIFVIVTKPKASSNSSMSHMLSVSLPTAFCLYSLE